MSIEAVIFDWAGTTVDFGSFAPVQAFINAFEKFGIKPTMEEVREPMGMLKRDHIRTMMEMPRIHEEWIRIHEKEFTQSDVEAVYECSEKAIMGILKDFTQVKPYVLDVTEELRGQNIKIGSTTGYTDEMMDIVVPAAKANGYAPDYWCSPNAVNEKGRPFPYMIFKNLETLGVSSVNRVIKVGDTVSDIKEGKAAGMRSVGIVEGSSVMGLSETEFQALSQVEKDEISARVRKVYENCGADYVIQNMSELPALVYSL